MSGLSDEFEFELPNRGDDRPGLDDLDDLVSDDFDADDDVDDFPEDAGEEDIDLVVALYREDGQPVVTPLDLDLANDLDGLITQLRRIPGDGGALGFVSIAAEFFVILRVRGKHVQVVLSDVVAAGDWPIARDAVDFLGIELPDEEDESAPVGDLAMLADAGLRDFELETIASDYDEDSTVLLERIAKKIKFGPQYAKAVASFE